jgi:polar amino acid transport system substrate-binding protein
MGAGYQLRGTLALALLGLAVCQIRAQALPEVPTDPLARQTLAPSGKLRVALYSGTPTSLLGELHSPEARGVGHDLGQKLAQSLGVPFEAVVFPNNAEVLAAVQNGTVDVAFANATPERARQMDFAPVCLEIELGYLVRKGSTVASFDEVDRAGVRLGVTAKSSSDTRFSRELRQATLVRAATVKEGVTLMNDAAIDVYATNKPTLFEMSDQLPGSRVLDGKWGMEHMTFAVPKGREKGQDFLQRFVEQARQKGWITAAVQRAGLRGAVPLLTP